MIPCDCKAANTTGERYQWIIPYRVTQLSPSVGFTVIVEWASDHGETCDPWYHELKAWEQVLKEKFGAEVTAAYGSSEGLTGELIQQLVLDDMVSVNIIPGKQTVLPPDLRERVQNFLYDEAMAAENDSPNNGLLSSVLWSGGTFKGYKDYTDEELIAELREDVEGQDELLLGSEIETLWSLVKEAL